MYKNTDVRTLHYLLAAVAVVAAVLFIMPMEMSDDSSAAVTWNVVFDPNGGTTGNDDYYTRVTDDAGSVYIPGGTFIVDHKSYTYSREGYTFLGWANSASATVPDYTEGHILEINSDVTLHAVWSLNTYNITLNIGTTSMVYQLKYGSILDISHMKNMVPTNMGDYVIVGWSTQEPVAIETTEGHIVYGIIQGDNPYSMKIRFRTPADLDLYPIYALKYTFSLSTSVELIGKTGCYYFTGAGTSGGILISGGSPYIYLDDLSLDFKNAGKSPFILSDGAVANVSILSDCTLTAGYTTATVNQDNYNLGCAAINVQTGTTLNILDTSIGTITCNGGSVKTTGSYSFWTGANITAYGYSGAGIGSNWNDEAQDAGCGAINVYGGSVVAVGGASYVAYRSNQRGITEDFIAAQGMGGEGATLNFVSGSVTATTGKINGFQDDSYNLIVGSNYGIAKEPMVYASLTNNGDAIVTAVGRSGGSVVSDNTVTVTFDVKNNAVIGGAQCFTIDGVGINLGGVSIQTGTVFVLDEDMISNNASVSVATQLGNYFTGTAKSSGNGAYTITLTQASNRTYHGSVTIFVNKAELSQGTNYYGTVNPYQEFTISGNRSTLNYTFTLSLHDTYELTEIMVLSDGVWVLLDESEYTKTISGQVYTIKIDLRMGQEDNNVSNDISFMITKKAVNVNFTLSYTGNQTLTEGMVTAEIVDPAAIEWDSGYLTGSQKVYYDDSRTFTIHTATAGNPLFLSVINTADDYNIKYIDNEDGTYSFTLYNIVEDIDVIIVFKDTVKVTLKQFWNSGNLDCVVLFANADGSRMTKGVTAYPETNTQYYYAFIEKNTGVHFTVEISEGREEYVGIQYISLAYAGNSNVSRLAYQTGSVYHVTSTGSDVTVTPEVTTLVHDVTLISNGNTYVFKVPHKSLLAAPTSDELGTLQSNLVWSGHELVDWTWGDETVSVGSPIEVEEDLTISANWNTDAIVYHITYILGGGTATNPTTYTVDDIFTLNAPVRTGYRFIGWTGTGLNETTATVSFNGYTGDRTYTAVWSDPLPITVNLVDNSGLITSIKDPVREYTFGTLYTNLPIYENMVDEGTGVTHIFAGWAFEDNTKITTTTRVSVDTEHTIHIIWIINNGYIINVDQAVGSGGKVTAPSSVATGFSAEIVITPDLGYYIGDIMINGVAEYTPVYVDNGDGTCTYTATEVFIVNGDGTYTFIYTPTENIAVHVDFGLLQFTFTVWGGISPYTEHSQTFNVTTPNIYVYTYYAAVTDYEFMGWTTVNGGTTATITTQLLVEMGTVGNVTYWEVWAPITYNITYVLNGGANNKDNPAEYTVGVEITLLAASKSGNTFKGWYDNEDFTGSPYTTFTPTESGGLTFYAKWAIKAPVAKDYVYNGALRVEVVASNSYTLSGTSSETVVGTYSVTITLNEGCVWDDDTTAPKEITWHILPRPVAIIANSHMWNYDGTEHSDSGYVLIGFLPGDVVSVTVTGSAEDEGFYTNRVTDYALTSGDIANYSVTVYDGMLTILHTPHAVVTIEPAAESPGADPNTLNVGRSMSLSVTSGTEVAGVERATAAESPRAGPKGREDE